MAGQDIEMNAFTLATDGAYIYAEATNGSQVKIKKSDLASVLAAQIGLNPKNVRKQLIIKPNETIDFGVKGGLIVVNTISLQEQCLVLFSCYGEWEGAISILSQKNNAFIVGSKATETPNKLIVYREDSTSLCYLKNTFSSNINIAYQVVGGFW